MASLTDCQWRLGELLLCDKAVQKSVGPHTAPTFPPTSSIEDPQGYIPGIIEVPVFVLQEQCWMLGLFALMNRCCYIGAIYWAVLSIFDGPGVPDQDHCHLTYHHTISEYNFRKISLSLIWSALVFAKIIPNTLSLFIAFNWPVLIQNSESSLIRNTWLDKW